MSVWVYGCMGVSVVVGVAVRVIVLSNNERRVYK